MKKLWRDWFEMQRKADRGISQKDILKNTLAGLQGYSCHSCHEPLGDPTKATIKRLIPYSKGGRDRPEDAVLLCPKCSLEQSEKRQVSAHLTRDVYAQVEEWRDRELPGRPISEVVSLAMNWLVSENAVPLDRGELSQLKKKAEEYDDLKGRMESIEKTLFTLFEKIAPKLGYSRTNPYLGYISEDSNDGDGSEWV